MSPSCRILIPVAWILGALVAAPLPAADRPNVIFILADDLGWGDLGHTGHPYVRTPNIDQLAAGGTVVSNFYVNSTVCSPSRAAFMTGRYPARLGFHHITSSLEVNKRRKVPDWLDPDITTVADVFKQAGYATAHFGKWHLGKYGASPKPEAYGFDAAAVQSGPGETLGRYHDNDPGAQAKAPEDPQSRLTQYTFDAGLDFIRAHRQQPFYLNLWTPLPHAPLRLTPKQREPYKDLVPKPEDPAFAPWMRDYMKSAPQLAEQMRMYLAAVTEVDHNVGRLLQALQELGMDERTLVVFSSDNGPEDFYIGNAANAGMGSPGPFRGRKRSIYEGGTRVPFIVRWPGHIPAGRVDRETLLSGIDFLPTVAALAGIPHADRELDGEDMSAALRGAVVHRKRPLFWEWFFEVVGNRDYLPPPLAVREGSWKFYTDYAGGAVELYDLKQDPAETRNVAAQNPAVVAQLKPAVLAWVKTLPPAEYRDEVAKGADRMKLLDIRKPTDREP
jgi:N-acetylgalactosamine-6-sulfatase